METKLLMEVAKNYISRSQQIRVVSENWVNSWIFCPNCGNNLNPFTNNKPVADFYCLHCSEEFELKSKQGFIGKKIVNGAYYSMIDRLESNNNPNFLFLTYEKISLEIRDFFVIPKYFFVPDIIEKRKPLNITAKRGGWVGCNIVLENIPELGKIYYINNGHINNKDDVLSNWSRTEFVKGTHNIEAKGWMLDVLICIEKIKKSEFSLDDIYGFESYLKIKHPRNNNIKAKIRQQLQYLRDRNVIGFIARGKYKINI
jgi:type II restriction enzyme